MNYKSDIKVCLLVGIAIAICVVALPFPAHTSCKQAELTLTDYPELFKKEFTIAVGGNTSQVLLKCASAMAPRLKEPTGKDVEVSREDKTGCNLTLIGIPDSNPVLSEASGIADAGKATVECPGRDKEILEILTSPWSECKALLIIAGSDQCEVKAGVALSIGSQELNVQKLSGACGEGREPRSPFFSKIGATLDFLLTLRGREQVPQEMKEIVMRDTVSVSIRFTHELNASEVESIEELGVEFVRLPKGEIAHSGTIYGAKVPWDRVDDLAELESVVRIESVWQPGVEEPVSQDSGKQKQVKGGGK